MKDILIITNYFPPEKGAASNRIYHLAEGLKKRGFKITVVTPLPNYPYGKIFNSFKGKLKHKRIENGILVHRLWIFASNSKNKLLRLFAMLSYSFSLIIFFLKHKTPNTVIIQSPPLLVAFTSLFCLKSKKRNLILNVSDLWPLAGLELNVFKKKFSYKILEKIEHYNYKTSNLILGQSEEILNHISSIYPEKDSVLYRNFPIVNTAKSNNLKNTNSKIKIVYAGLLGVAQGVFKLCQKLEYSQIEFHIYGAGNEKENIENFIKNNPNLPITYHGEVTREKLHKVILEYDITIIPLLNRIYGSVPSKIFEYAHLGIPLLYFGGGEGEKIVLENELGWVAECGNYDHLNKIIATIKKEQLNHNLRTKIKETAQQKFNLEIQLNYLVNKLFPHL